MRKSTLSRFILIILIMQSALLQAQSEWQWGKRAQNYTKEIAVDNNGNSYVLWAVGDQANVDGNVIPTNGSTDVGITSFRCDGTYRWTKVVGTSSPDAGYGIATDTMGGVYVLCHIGSSNASNIHVDNDTTLNPTMKKMMLLKYDTAGNYLWLRMPEADTITSVTSTGGFNLTVEPNGTAHVMCILQAGSYAGGAYVTTQPDEMNIHALKYDKDGNFINGLHFDVTRPANAGIIPYGFTLMYDPLGTHYYWAGRRYDPYTISFGTTNIPGSNFLACFDATGNVLWVQKSNNDVIPTWLLSKPTTDNAGNVYVAGTSYNDFGGGPGDGFGSYSFNNTMGPHGFPILVKFDASGNVLFASGASCNADNAGKAVAYINGTIALAGDYAGDMDWDGASIGPNDQYYNSFLARFNATSGTLMGIDTLSSGWGVDEFVTTLTPDHQGGFLLGGEFYGDITIAGTTHIKQDGSTDGYVAKFGSANCDCVLPTSAFTMNATGLLVDFTYTGSQGVDSIVWSFGDGQSATGINITHTYTDTGSYTACATAYDSCGSNMYCMTFAAFNTYIADQGAFSGVRLYPNPITGDVVFIEGLDSAVSYQVYNSLGMKVKHGRLSGPQSDIDISDLPVGMYLLQLKDNLDNTSFIKVFRQ